MVALYNDIELWKPAPDQWAFWKFVHDVMLVAHCKKKKKKKKKRKKKQI